MANWGSEESELVAVSDNKKLSARGMRKMSSLRTEPYWNTLIKAESYDLGYSTHFSAWFSEKKTLNICVRILRTLLHTFYGKVF